MWKREHDKRRYHYLETIDVYENVIFSQEKCQQHSTNFQLSTPTSLLKSVLNLHFSNQVSSQPLILFM